LDRNSGCLWRWDGYRFRNYRPDSRTSGNLPGNDIAVVHSDTRGHLWIGGDAGLSRYDQDHDRFINYTVGSGGLSSIDIRAITDDGTGGVWVATSNGLDHLDVDRGVIGHLHHDDKDPISLSDNHIVSVLRDSEGRLWIAAIGGLFRRDSDTSRLTAVPLPPFLNAETCAWCLLEDSERRIWIGTNSGAFVVEPGTDKPRAVSESDPTAPPLQSEGIRAITEARPGEIWLGTHGHGIIGVDTRTFVTRHFRHEPTLPTSLADDKIWALYRDRTGMVWVGTSRGLGSQDPRQRAVTTLCGIDARKNGISDGDVHAVLPMPDGRIWLGLGANGIDLLDPRTGRVEQMRSSPDQHDERLPVTEVTALAAVRDGVYAATYKGLFHNTPPLATVTSIASHSHQDDDASLTALLVDAGTLWIGSVTDGLRTLDLADLGTASTVPFAGNGQLTDPRVMVIALGPVGSIWIGTQNGLNLIDTADGAVKHIPLVPGNSTSPGIFYVSTIITDRQGRLWVGTQGAGIIVLDGRPDHKFLRRLGIEDGLPHANIDKLLQAGNGTIWASTDDGLAVIDPMNFVIRALHQAEGVAIDSYWGNSGAETTEGKLLFGGIGGLTVVQPDRLTNWHYQPPVVVTDVRIGGKPVPPGRLNGSGSHEPLMITPEANSLSVEFSVLDFSAPERNRYAYRLEGYDRDWIETDTLHRLAAYTNLPPGEYRLRLRGTNRDGVWSETKSAIFVRVLPAWYQTSWFRLSEGVLGLLLVAILIQARTAFLRRRQRELEKLVTEQTVELRANQRQLEQIAYSDTLTALPNRRMFIENFGKLAAQTRRDGGGFALLLIDLDGFKKVNDTLGHDAGDALLIDIASRLLGAVREADRVARVGGDEFAILLPGVQNPTGVERLCQRIIENSAAKPFFNGDETKVGVGIGIALFPDHGQTQEEIYKSADLALYDAKRSGRNTWRWYDTALIK
jgi:diguanylate cyclase (GGDEF)-like protein